LDSLEDLDLGGGLGEEEEKGEDLNSEGKAKLWG